MSECHPFSYLAKRKKQYPQKKLIMREEFALRVVADSPQLVEMDGIVSTLYD